MRDQRPCALPIRACDKLPRSLAVGIEDGELFRVVLWPRFPKDLDELIGVEFDGLGGSDHAADDLGDVAVGISSAVNMERRVVPLCHDGGYVACNSTEETSEGRTNGRRRDRVAWCGGGFVVVACEESADSAKYGCLRSAVEEAEGGLVRFFLFRLMLLERGVEYGASKC